MKVLDAFERPWRSQDDRKKGNLEAEIQTLLTQLESKRKRSRIVPTTCGVYTVMSTVVIGVMSGKRSLAVEEVWPAIVVQVLAPIALTVALGAQFSRERHVAHAASIHELTRLRDMNDE